MSIPKLSKDARLSKQEFQLPTVKLAKSLIGCFLTHKYQGKLIGGRIVETEAYLSKEDPACHAHKGKSKRNEAMFLDAGFSYVYLIYGMYHCFNVVSAKKDCGEAVLVRALEPLFGIEQMMLNRNSKQESNLCSGPGKLTQALGITKKHDKLCLMTSKIGIHPRTSFAQHLKSYRIQTSTRIGISNGKELPLRFLLRDSKFVSKPA